MKSFDKIVQAAIAFEKSAQEVQVSQMGTTELFFGDTSKQQAFNTAIQDPKGKLAKVLFDYYSKTNGKPASFTLKVTAEPNVGAKWSLQVSPAALTAPLAKALDAAYRAAMGKSMAETQKIADAAAKKGAGSGELLIGSLDVA